MRNRTMTSLADNSNLNSSRTSHYRTWYHTDVPLIKVRNVVESINLFNTFKTSVLDHRLSTSSSLLSWLEQESNLFAFWYLISVIKYDLSSS
jgi:hypothetical protein